MKLLIDGISLTKPISGISRYLRSILMSHHFADQITDYQCALPQPCHPHHANLNTVFHHNESSQLGWYFKNLNTVCNHLQPDIFWGPAHRLPFGLPKNVKQVLTIHDLVWRQHPRTMRLKSLLSEHLFFRRSIRRADRIICVSQSTADDLSFFYPEITDRIRITLLGTDTAQTTPSLPDKITALFVGTFEPRKNLQRLIDAVAKLPDHVRNNFCLQIVGQPGWGNINLEAIINKHNLGHIIQIIERPSDTDLQQLYAGCSFIVLPSLYEGFGLPIAEAFQYGKPVLTSDLSSMPEVAGAAAVLINPLKIDSIADGLGRLATNRDLYNDLAAKAVLESKRFNWEKTTEQTLSVFSELI